MRVRGGEERDRRGCVCGERTREREERAWKRERLEIKRDRRKRERGRFSWPPFGHVHD